MSLVVGVRVFDGVLLLSDCRLTARVSGSSWDVGQKVFCLADHTALAFVGDVEHAGRMVRDIRTHFPRTDRPFKVLRGWLPSFMRRRFRRLESEIARRPESVGFMVASVVGPGKDGLIPWESRLYTMESPNFVPREAGMLEVRALGTGAGLAASIDANRAAMYIMTAGGHGVESAVQAANLRNAFLRSDKAGLHVGGFMPVVKVGTLWRETRGTVVGACGFDHHFNFLESEEKEVIALTYNPEDDSWIQRNVTSGKSVPLRRPWDPLPPTPVTFDDLDHAMSRKRSNLRPVPGVNLKVGWHIEGSMPPKAFREHDDVK